MGAFLLKLDHQTRLNCAEKYLAFCNQNGMQPAEVGIEEINNFIEEVLINFQTY